MSENGTTVVGSVPARDGRIKVVLSESKSSSLLGEKTVRVRLSQISTLLPTRSPFSLAQGCDKNSVVTKDNPEAKSGAEASLDESTLKKDPAAEKDPAADKVDSDKAKAMSSAHAPSPNAVFWSKLDPPTSPNGTKEAPALKPVTEDAPAFKPVTGGGEPPPPSIKEFPAETPAAAVSALHSAPRVIRPLLFVDPPRFHCVGRRRLGRLGGQGVSSGDARPGGERLARCCAHTRSLPQSVR